MQNAGKLKEVLMDGKQAPMFPPSAEELVALRNQLAKLVGEYIAIEDEKKAADADFNERLTDLWDEIRGIRARIKDGE